MLAFALLTTIGCFKTEETTLDFTTVPFDNEFVQSDTAVIQAFTSSRTCPDGQQARFFAVYDPAVEASPPVAIVFHSGAFDYVRDAAADDPLTGSHYHMEDRLSRTWSINKVWETVGQYPGVVDASEVNTGALGAALVNAGYLQLYPANCWGDMWHDREGESEYENDFTRDFFFRDGGAFAADILELVMNPTFASTQGFENIRYDSSNLTLIGLGEGGRAVVALLEQQGPLVDAVLLDSSPDLLSPYWGEQIAFADEIDGFERIFAGSLEYAQQADASLTLEDVIDDYSLYSLVTDGGTGQLPPRTAYIYSDGDPRLPQGTVEPTAELLESLEAGGMDRDVWVHNTQTSGHVFLNGDIKLADAMVQYLSTGVKPAL